MKEKKLRIEDALSATKAAIEEGVVSGGGIALINTIQNVEKLIENLEYEEEIGAKIILKALEEPLRQIVINAGIESAVVINKVKESKKGIGFDVIKGIYVNMKEAGIIDPTKVTRSALQNATSIASMVLTTESLVADVINSKGENYEDNNYDNPINGIY